MCVLYLSLKSHAERGASHFSTRFKCALSLKRLTEIQSQLIGQAPPEFFRQPFAVFQEMNQRLLRHNPVLATAILMLLVYPDKGNSLVPLLLDEQSRKSILDDLCRMDVYSNETEVRLIESKLYRFLNGKKPLFSVSDDLLSDMVLEDYLLQRKVKYAVVMNMSIAADGVIQKEDYVPLRNYLDTLESEMFPLQRAIDELIREYCQKEAGISYGNSHDQVDEYLSTVSVKSLRSAIVNIIQLRKKDPCKDISIGDINDLLRGRIVVKNYSIMEKFMTLIEKKYAGNVLQVKNKFIEHKGKAYRAIHYYIRISDTILFELQLKTKAQVIIGELEHDLVFKADCPGAQISPTEHNELKKEVIALHWGVQKTALQAYTRTVLDDKNFVRTVKKKDPEFLQYLQGFYDK